MIKEIPTQAEPQSNAAKPLLGKVAVITGSSKGIGRGFALELARRGAKVVINYSTAQSDDSAQQLVKEIAALEASPSPQCITVKADLRNPSSAPEIIRQTVEAFGPRIDILINNAATSITKPTPDITPEDFDSVFHLNVRAPLLMMQAMLPYLGAGSRIVNISSIAARRATEQICLYHSSKAALEALTHQWSMELAPNGHTVNTVSPGPPGGYGGDESADPRRPSWRN